MAWFRDGICEDEASTSRMWQLGQIADTVSRSSEISLCHSAISEFELVPDGSGELAPTSLTFVKQPFAVVHGARPKLER